MAKMNLKVVMYALLSVLVLQLLSQVGAVDIIAYDNYNACSGTSRVFANVPAGQCCDLSATPTGAVGINNAGKNVISVVFAGGACIIPDSSDTGQVCYTGGFTGALWNSTSRRSLLGELASAPCESQMKPNGVAFTEGMTKGHWVLTSSDADELHSQMQNVPNAEKTSWLKSRGATYNELENGRTRRRKFSAPDSKFLT